MSIKFIKEKKTFVLNTASTTYAFDILGEKYLRHIYYGKRTSDVEPAELKMFSFSPYIHDLGPSYSPDSTPNEISFFGSGDFRANSLRIKGADGTGVTDFTYSSYRIFNGRREIDGIPFARADEKTRTLEITMLDSVSGCKLLLYYTVFEKYDMISRYMVIENRGKQSVKSMAPHPTKPMHKPSGLMRVPVSPQPLPTMESRPTNLATLPRVTTYLWRSEEYARP